MPRALQTSGMGVPLASSASASRSLRMICSGEWRMRFIGSPPALKGENDSHIGWTSPGGAGQGRIFDAAVFRPLMGWATAWSFDRLRLWLEEGIDPATSAALALIHAVTRGVLGFIWV